MEHNKYKKIYISLPITGFDIAERRKTAQHLKLYLMEIYPNSEIITPFDLYPPTDNDHPYSFYMGKCIECLIDCDAIFLHSNWQLSKGCMTEFEVARIYGIEMKFV